MTYNQGTIIPLSRFDIPDGGNDRNEKGDRNNDDIHEDGDRDGKALSTPTDNLSLGV